MKTAIITYEEVCSHISACLNRKENPSYEKNQADGVEMIEEYAQQDAIQFAKWKDDWGYHWLPKYDIWVNSEVFPGVQFNDEQLYKKYKDEKLTAIKG